MKKTLITLFALAGVAGADTLESVPTPVVSISDYSITTSQITFSTTADTAWAALDGQINASGFTLQITLIDWTAVKGPLFYLSTNETAADGNDYQTSLVSFGYSDANNISGWSGATLFKSSNGSANSGSVTYNTSIIPDNLTSHADLSDGKLAGAITLFITGENGTITLYEVDKNSSLVEICSTTNVGTGTAERIVFSQWASSANNNNRATMDLAVYSSVLTTSQMNSLMVPEPTTATLSLLALAGLAARRRRASR